MLTVFFGWLTVLVALLMSDTRKHEFGFVFRMSLTEYWSSVEIASIVLTVVDGSYNGITLVGGSVLIDGATGIVTTGALVIFWCVCDFVVCIFEVVTCLVAATGLTWLFVIFVPAAIGRIKLVFR